MDRPFLYDHPHFRNLFICDYFEALQLWVTPSFAALGPAPVIWSRAAFYVVKEAGCRALTTPVACSLCCFTTSHRGKVPQNTWGHNRKNRKWSGVNCLMRVHLSLSLLSCLPLPVGVTASLPVPFPSTCSAFLLTSVQSVFVFQAHIIRVAKLMMKCEGLSSALSCEKYVNWSLKSHLQRVGDWTSLWESRVSSRWDGPGSAETPACCVLWLKDGFNTGSSWRTFFKPKLCLTKHTRQGFQSCYFKMKSRY